MRFAVVGAGPIGLEMALAAREAGHEVTVYEADDVGAHVGQWGHVQLFTPWSMNTTARGREAVGTAGLDDPETCPTGAELVDRYLRPLAAGLDVRRHHRVTSMTRPWKGKGAQLGSKARMDSPFQLLIDTPQGEHTAVADIVVDCTGVFGDPAPLGTGGGPVPGERGNSAVRYGPLAVDDLAGKRVLLVGDGASAATVLTDLLDLEPLPSIHWITPSAQVPGFVSPPDDPLPLRRELVATCEGALEVVHHHPHAAIARLEGSTATLDTGETVEVDAVLACTGFRPDHRLSRELQVHLCWGSEGPMKLAAALLSAKGDGPADCLAGGAEGPELLQSPEPGFFLLGNKSYGRRSDFLLGVGHRQVEDVLSLVSAYGV
ncbi:MAG: NAD(P)-binding domain-containing protein [Myxococcales bacterium]|nr:NAD(P)-binding domain-containing protein [Myxococcales bacterium]MCB9672439.1 NAD(P)-binding domain-containing protein [Alphaproteobacteria bacterium]MCB9693054.1 NAD(P)-binding domain-containing protein [Alphaproteobacteria bacterium]